MPPKRKKQQNNTSSSFTPRTLRTEESFHENPGNNDNISKSRRHSTASSVVAFGFANNTDVASGSDHRETKNNEIRNVISSPDPKIPAVVGSNNNNNTSGEKHNTMIPSLPRFSTV